MRFRVKYSTTGMSDLVATDPGGWDEAAIGFDRDSKLLSLVEFFESSFTTYGDNGQPVQYDTLRTINGGRDWILAAEILNGADSQIQQLFEIDENDTGNWEYFFSSVLSMNEIAESMNKSHLLDIVCSQQDFWAKFVKRLDTPVDLKAVVDLDGGVVAAVPSFTLPLPSQIIRSKFEGSYGLNGAAYAFSFLSDGVDFGIINFDTITLDEIETRNSSIPNDTADTPEFSILISCKYAGDYAFDIQVYGQVTVGVDILGNFFDVILVAGTNVVTLTKVNTVVGLINITTYTYSGTLTLAVEDKIQLYFSAIAPGTRRNAIIYGLVGGVSQTFLNIVADTIAPDSTTDAFLSYDVIKGVIKRICGATFKSDYLGNPYTSDAYGVVGCGSNLAHMLGLHIRGYSLADKPFQLSAQNWYDGYNPIHCIGIGYEKVNGVDTIVCEKAEHFFDDSNVSVNFFNIYDIKRTYDQGWQFNKFIFGNEKWESQAATGIGVPSGIDDPQSQRTWTNIFKFIGKELKQLSKFVTASSATEETRRVGIHKNSNYSYDNDIFAIKLHDNGAGAYVPETNQPFSAITDLLNSSTRYNSDLTPARNLLRWAKYWSGCLQDYVGSAVKYASGVGNFKMTSTKTTACDGDDTGNVVAENGDFVVGSDYLFFPMPLEINHKLDWTTYKHLRDHKNYAITISQDNNVGEKAFIKSLKYYKAKGEVKMIVWPKRRFSIRRIESITNVAGHAHVRYFEIAFEDAFS